MIELVIKVMYYQLLEVVAGTRRAKGDTSPLISETVSQEVVAWANNDDTIDAGRQLSKSGTSSSHSALKTEMNLGPPLETGSLLLSTAY
jgi:hypothetical protein